MREKGSIVVILLIALVVIVGIGGYLLGVNRRIASSQNGLAIADKTNPVVTSSTQPVSSPQSSSVDLSKIYLDSKNGFTLNYPSNWKADSPGADPNVQVLGVDKNTLSTDQLIKEGRPEIIITVLQNPQRLDSKDFAYSIFEDQRVYPGFTTQLLQPLDLSGLDATYINSFPGGCCGSIGPFVVIVHNTIALEIGGTYLNEIAATIKFNK